MLKDAALLRELEQNGFVVIDAHLIAETDRLNQYIHQNFSLSFSDFYYSLLSNTFETNVALKNEIARTLHSFYEAYFDGYRTITESFLAKAANTPKELLLHQDWCYTDESKFSAYNIWIPLNDVTETNGAMIFLPGSHLWFNNLRSTSLPTARVNSAPFIGHGAKTVSLKKGQVLVFHPAVFHGSYPNLSNQNRIVVTSTIMQANAPFIYYNQVHKDTVNILKLEDDTFLKALQPLAMGEKTNYPANGSIKYTHQPITEADLIAKIT